MRYRIYKTRRLLKPYKIQGWQQTGWEDIGFALEYRQMAVIRVGYYWTMRGAWRQIKKFGDCESVYE